jgi:hypothetical protein
MNKQEQIEQAQKTGDIETMHLLENDLPMAVCSHSCPPCEGCKQIFRRENCVSEGLIEKVRREERERCVEVLIRRINDMEKGITNPYKSGSITNTFTDCILWGLRKAIDELEVRNSNSKTQE